MESIFRYKMKVRDYELDAQGIVNNANYQHYYEVARHEFLEEHNVNFVKLHEDGIDAIVSSIHIKYKRSLVSGDYFYVTINLEKQGIRYYFNQQVIRESDNVVCSEARVEVACISNGRPIKPDFFDEVFAQYL
jgi:acyl-CoA thioester hydrolase